MNMKLEKIPRHIGIVMDGNGRFIEVQGTGEKTPFERGQLDSMLRLAEAGIEKLIGVQRDIVSGTSDVFEL